MPGGRAAAIQRDWYQINSYRLTGDGHAVTCGAKIVECSTGRRGNGTSTRLIHLVSERE